MVACMLSRLGTLGEYPRRICVFCFWVKEMPKSTDANQKTIVADLRKAGATVHSLHEVGYGCPDLLVGFRGRNFIIEVKMDLVTAKLTPLQVEFHESWRGQVDVARTSEEALRIIGAIE